MLTEHHHDLQQMCDEAMFRLRAWINETTFRHALSIHEAHHIALHKSNQRHWLAIELHRARSAPHQSIRRKHP